MSCRYFTRLILMKSLLFYSWLFIINVAIRGKNTSFFKCHRVIPCQMKPKKIENITHPLRFCWNLACDHVFVKETYVQNFSLIPPTVPEIQTLGPSPFLANLLSAPRRILVTNRQLWSSFIKSTVAIELKFGTWRF